MEKEHVIAFFFLIIADYDAILCRTSTILNELQTLFVSIEAIPVQVLLTG